MRRDRKPSRFRVVFSLLMTAFLLLGMTSPLASAQGDATPESPGTMEELSIDPPVNEGEETAPADPPADDGGEPADPPVNEGEESADVPEDDLDEGTVEESEGSIAGPEVAPAGTTEEINSDFGIMAVETVYATLITQCTVTSSTWGAQMRNVSPFPEVVTFHFTDGTSVDAASGFSPGAAMSYRLTGHTGKTVANITAEIDTAANPNWWFQQTVGPCPGEYDVTGTVTNLDTGEPIVGATVTVLGTDLTAETDGDGTYSIPRVPRGQYDFEFSAEGYSSATVNAYVNQATSRVVDAELAPVTEAMVTIEVSSAVATWANTLPEGSTWTVTNLDNPALSITKTFAPEHLNLRANITVEDPVPFGRYEVEVDAGPTFQPYTEIFTVDEPTEHFNVVLQPVSEATVTITVSSADADVADTLPADATWTIRHVQTNVTFSDTFAAGHLQLPAEIPVNDPVMFGHYEVMVDAGPNFEPFGPVTFEVNDPTGEEFSIELVPARTAAVTITVTSSDLDLTNTLPADASWTVRHVESDTTFTDTFAAGHLDLPAEITVNDRMPFGTYEITVSAGPAFEAYGPAEVTIDSQDTELTIELTPATYPVIITAETQDGGSAEGAVVYIDDVEDNTEGFRLLAIDPVAGELDADNSFNAGDLPVGEYRVIVDATEQGYGVGEATFSVPVDGAVEVYLEVEPTTGWIVIQKIYCDDVDETIIYTDEDTFYNDTFLNDDADCATGAGSFTIYLVGDGTDEIYGQIDVWETGFGYMELAPGTYEVVEEGSNARVTVEIVAGEVAFLGVINPGEAPAPRNGTMNVSTFVCTNISETIFFSDTPAVLAAGLPAFEPACEPIETDVTFYLVGDGTADYSQLTTTGGVGSIELAPGTYEVVEESTQARYFIEIYAGFYGSLDIQIPAGGEVIPGSSVNVVKFYCETATDVEWVSLTSAQYATRDQVPGAPDCAPGAATFTFYLVGDGTAEYAQLKVYGAASIGLEPGTYEVVEEETQARFTLEVLEGENTILLVTNPMPEDGVVPGTPDKPGTPDDGKKDDSRDEVKVTGLPATGAGSSDSVGALAMAAAAASALAAAGALRLRKES